MDTKDTCESVPKELTYKLYFCKQPIEIEEPRVRLLPFVSTWDDAETSCTQSDMGQLQS